MTQQKRLVIVQPYVPLYRVQFFARLIEVLAQDGVECVVAAAEPEAAQKDRGDSAEADWIVRYRSRSIPIGRRRLTLGGSYRAWRDADAVIVGHLGSSFDTYRALLDGIRGRRRAGVWGHIKSYVAKPHPLDALLEVWQLRVANHVFAYTRGGGDYARRHGVLPNELTVVANAVDTSGLKSEIDSLTDRQVEDFGRSHGLLRGRVIAFVGALDDTKRIDFVASFLEHLWVMRPDVRVLIGGAGGQKFLLEPAIRRGQVIDLGYVDDATKAQIGRWASALIMPGRIGLVAVESLMLKVPIISTDWPYHAPEAEYLTLGVSRYDAPDEPLGYAQFVVDFLKASHQAIPEGHPTIETMVDNFRRGVLKLLAMAP